MFPFPSQLFSLILIAKAPPLVPTPAPALISPVGFSSTFMFKIFKSAELPSVTSAFTSVKIFLDLIFAIVLSNLIFEKGSPSSIKNSPLITSSFVDIFPVTLIRSIEILSDSKILNFTSIVSFSITSSTLCSTNCKLFFAIKSSKSSKSFFIVKGE